MAGKDIVTTGRRVVRYSTRPMAAPASFRPRLAAPALLDRSPALLCVLAAAGFVVQQELRTPLHVPGHRGLLWLGLLVAVRLGARRPGAAPGGAGARGG